MDVPGRCRRYKPVSMGLYPVPFWVAELMYTAFKI